MFHFKLELWFITKHSAAYLETVYKSTKFRNISLRINPEKTNKQIEKKNSHKNSDFIKDSSYRKIRQQ